MIIGPYNVTPFSVGGSSGVTPTPPAQEYYNRLQFLNDTNGDAVFIIQDGAMIASLGGVLYKFGGWGGPNGSETSLDEHFQSIDNGVTWTALPVMDCGPRHWFGCHTMNGKIWVFGSDSENPAKDVWTWDPVNLWVEVTSDWGGPGDRILFAHWTDGTYLYISGGQDSNFGAPTMFLDTWRSSNGSTWVKTGDLPVAITDFAMGNGAYNTDTGEVLILGGGQYGADIASNLNPHIYKSANGGATWTFVATLDLEMRCTYGSTDYFDGKYWHLMGYANGDNQAGLMYSTTGATWTEFVFSDETGQTITARHATGSCIHNGALTYCCGNMHNDTFRLIKTDYPYTVTHKVRWWWTGLEEDDIPSPTKMTKINTYIDALDAAGQLVKIDHLGLTAGNENDNQLLIPFKTTAYKPWINDDMTLATTGVTGGVGKKLRSQWIASKHSVACTFDNISFGLWPRTKEAEFSIDGGVAGGSFTSIYSRDTDNNAYFYNHDAGPNIGFVAAGTTPGPIWCQRPSETTRNAVINDVTTPINSTAIGNFTIESYLGSQNNGLGGTAPSTREQMMHIYCKGDADLVLINSLTREYFIASGVWT